MTTVSLTLDSVMHSVGVRSKLSAFESAATAFAGGVSPAAAAESPGARDSAAGAAGEPCAAAPVATSAAAARTSEPSHRIEWVIVVTPLRRPEALLLYNVTRRGPEHGADTHRQRVRSAATPRQL